MLLGSCKPAEPLLNSTPTPSPAPSPISNTLKVTSTAFVEGGSIPPKYTCDRENISPPLTWGSGPSGTQSWVIVVEDPDAPGGTWSHWMVFNLPAGTHELMEHQPATVRLGDGAVQGLNDFKQLGYGGPCPPNGTHRYVFRVFALDTILPLASAPDRPALLNALRGHILAEGTLTGKYSH
jgi:Raf kinase inhibitor-like YbhB/YbcL family protein